MTKVFYKHEKSMHKFSCKGHANYDLAGKDIVCAAISILCSSLILSVQQLGYDVYGEDGNIEFTIDGYDTIELRTIFKTVMNGFDLLAEQYPDHVKII